ncbi:MAG TPA: hypothetical protein P5526_16375 [Anaerolineae bacterium]|nr:hypothetical protein [Anaerolineae bacterium]
MNRRPFGGLSLADGVDDRPAWAGRRACRRRNCSLARNKSAIGATELNELEQDDTGGEVTTPLTPNPSP